MCRSWENKRVPGTRDKHMFLPVSLSTIQVKHVSEDDFSFSVNVLNTAPQKSASKNLSQEPQLEKDYAPGQYVANDSHWWLGNIICLSSEFSDAKVQFLHPHGPATSFHWHQKMTHVGFLWSTFGVSFQLQQQLVWAAITELQTTFFQLVTAKFSVYVP